MEFNAKNMLALNFWKVITDIDSVVILRVGRRLFEWAGLLKRVQQLQGAHQTALEDKVVLDTCLQRWLISTQISDLIGPQNDEFASKSTNYNPHVL